MLYLRYLSPAEAKYAIEEVHEGIYDNHLGAQALAYKLIWSRYFGPTMRANIKVMVQKCDKCQRFSNMPWAPASKLKHFSYLWSFTQWRLDIFGPFPPSSRHKKLLVVDNNYFIKWVKVKPLVTISKHKVTDFLQKNAICILGCLRFW